MIHQYIFQVRNFSSIVPATCLEIGALDGEYSELLARTFGLEAENLYVVEPNPSMQDALERRFPGSHVWPWAVSNSDGMVTLNRVESTERSRIGCSSLLNRVDEWAAFLDRKPVEVPSVSGQNLLSRVPAPVDLCIVDVEGLTFEVLSSFGKQLDRVRSLLIECEHGSVFAGQKLFPDVEQFLKSNGFRMMAFQYAYANQSDSVWIREDCVELDFRPGR